MQLSDYAKSLPDPERSRYIIKIAKCGGDDPLALSDDHFMNDVGFYPSVDRADIRDYLVHGTSFMTREQLKSYKSLEAHNYVTSGLVEPPRVKVRDGNGVAVGKVCVLIEKQRPNLHPRSGIYFGLDASQLQMQERYLQLH
ncbi:uncharacterized protein LOC142586061 [Dermacentor variabilis]|uniref:uncharacterized protein LOC142586061 n=1 Tax=Dermacentor variabilis TaxID=34621 RepID=UPI003F5B662F